VVSFNHPYLGVEESYAHCKSYFPQHWNPIWNIRLFSSIIFHFILQTVRKFITPKAGRILKMNELIINS